MEIKQLQQEAIKGTELYLHYLKEKQVGSEAHLTKPPTILAPNCTKLLVDHVVRSLQTVRVLIRGEPTKGLKLKREQNDNHVLYSMGDSSFFTGLKEQDVILLSDMTFLVEHIYAFLQQYELKLLGKRAKTSVMPVFENATEEQCAAAFGILNNPYAYVWGPSGAGKTTHVLAPSTEELLRAGKRVVLAAPTNQTADTALMNVLELLEDDARQQVIQLGTPTKELLARYPEVCEKQETEKGAVIPKTWEKPFWKRVKEAAIVWDGRHAYLAAAAEHREFSAKSNHHRRSGVYVLGKGIAVFGGGYSHSLVG